MHFAYFRSVSWSCCCCSGVNCGRAAAKYFWQAWNALRTFGSLRSNVRAPPPGRTLPLESTVGSGKSLTPFWRMHCDAFSSAASRSACELAGVAAAASSAVEVVLSAMEATPGAAEELPPQAASTREASSASAAGPSTRKPVMDQVNQPPLRGPCEILGARRGPLRRRGQQELDGLAVV